MHRRYPKLAWAIILLGIVLSAGVADSHASSYKAERIVRKHVAAIGGDRLASVVALRAVGTVELRAFSVPFTLWRQRPNLSRIELAIMGADVIQAYDGDHAWWINPIAGSDAPSELPADFAREVALWADFDGPLVGYKKRRHKLKYLGKEDLDTGPAFKIRVATSSGDEMFIYIDTQTYFEVKRTHTQHFHGEQIEVNTHFSDFVEHDGVTTPTKIEGVGFGGERFTMWLQTIDLDVDADTSRFEMPVRKESGLGY